MRTRTAVGGWVGFACMLAGAGMSSADPGEARPRWFLPDGSLVVVEAYPPHGTSTTLTRTVVPTGAAVLQSTILGSPVDLDKDGRDDLLLAYEHVCLTPSDAATPDAGPVQSPAGDFVVMLNRADGVVVKQHARITGAAPAALWNVSVQKQGRAQVMRAAGMKAGDRPTPTGEMYEFRWGAGDVVLGRRFPGSG